MSRVAVVILSVVLAMISAVAFNAPAFAHDDDVPGKMAEIEFGYVGVVDFPITCENEESQEQFNKALALYSHMTYGFSRAEFQAIAEREPECAMAYWGVAMTLTHPVWPGIPGESTLRAGADAVAKARALATKVSQREQMYIEAVATLYDDWDSMPYRNRIENWMEAQKKIHESYPDDDEAAVLYALALVAVGDSHADSNYDLHQQAGAILDEIYKRHPEHPGVIHYTIHAFDKPPLAERAVPMARAYGRVAPNVPHALHMPTHIYTRLGMWTESKDWNERSRQATLPMRVDGRLTTHEYAHVTDYLMYAHLQTGQDENAKALIKDVVENGPHLNTIVSAYALAALPARYALERADWKEAANLEPRWDGEDPEISWDNYSPCEAVTYYARGVGGALSGQPDITDDAEKNLEKLRVAALQSQIPFWEKRVRIQLRAVRSCIAYAKGDHDLALSRLENVADMEDQVGKHPVMPAVVYPVRELYAILLMEQGQYEAAHAAFMQNLKIRPGRFNSIGGAARAAELLGNKSKAQELYSQLLQLAPEADTDRPELQYAKDFLAR